MSLHALLAGELGAAGTPGLQAAGLPVPEAPQEQAEALHSLTRLLLLSALLPRPEPGPVDASINAFAPPEQVAGPLGGGLLAFLLRGMMPQRDPMLDVMRNRLRLGFLGGQHLAFDPRERADPIDVVGIGSVTRGGPTQTPLG